MAAAYYARRKQCGQCPQGRPGPQSRVFGIVCCLVWAGVWLWFGARTLRLARRILACQQFGTACRRALYAGARAQRLQRR